MLGSVQKSVYIRHFLVCTNVINNGVMVMYRPPAYYSGKVPDEKLIFNKEWPKIGKISSRSIVPYLRNLRLADIS